MIYFNVRRRQILQISALESGSYYARHIRVLVIFFPNQTLLVIKRDSAVGISMIARFFRDRSVQRTRVSGFNGIDDVTSCRYLGNLDRRCIAMSRDITCIKWIDHKRESKLHYYFCERRSKRAFI